MLTLSLIPLISTSVGCSPGNPPRNPPQVTRTVTYPKNKLATSRFVSMVTEEQTETGCLSHLGRFKAGGHLIDPVFGKDALYVGDGRGRVHAFDLYGRLKWIFHGKGRVRGIAVSQGGGRIVVTARATDSPRAWLYVLNTDGKTLWSKEMNDWVGAPMISKKGEVYVGSDDYRLYVFDSEGRPRWTVRTGGMVSSTPVKGRNGSIYFASGSSKLYAVDEKGGIKWTFQAGGPLYAKPSLGPRDTIVFGCEDSKVYAVSPGGKQLWNFFARGLVHCSPAVTKRGSIVFGSSDGTIYSLRPDGTLEWSRAMGGAIISSPVVEKEKIVATVAGEGVVALSADGTRLGSLKEDVEPRTAPAPGPQGLVSYGDERGYVHLLRID
ncbi:MAG: outer membrane protein assembly factor BamB family protein [Candidatus Aquicultorales bacterium]